MPAAENIRWASADIVSASVAEASHTGRWRSLLHPMQASTRITAVLASHTAPKTKSREHIEEVLHEQAASSPTTRRGRSSGIARPAYVARGVYYFGSPRRPLVAKVTTPPLAIASLVSLPRPVRGYGILVCCLHPGVGVCGVSARGEI